MSWFKKYLLNNKAFSDSLLINFFYLLVQFLRHFFASGFKYYRISNFLELKSSDTLVIIGAGSTVNELSDDQLQELGSYDVAGLSYTCILPVRQTFYFYESPSEHEQIGMLEHANKILPIIIRNYKKGSLQNIIWKNSENKIFNRYFNFDNFLTPVVCSILSDNPLIIRKILRCTKAFGLNKYFLVQKRGSIAALVQFGVFLKYQKILFVGVDLNNQNYFFENDKFNHYNFTSPNQLDDSYNGNIHRTNDPAISIPIIDVLKIFFDEETNTKFFVSSRKSELIRFLNLWQWRKS